MRKKFFSLLVLLAAVVTSAMAQEESLLTTLTFGESETYGETTSGVVSVTATNVYMYNGTYGWLLAEESSLSVTAKEGYTITKCVFHQNAKTPITDTEAPFEIHTNYWGGIIEDPEEDMNGVTSIEVYGYANAGGGSTATVVTITNSDFPASGNSFTKDGVTVSAGMIDRGYGNIMKGGSFSTTLGNFTQIEVSANDVHRISGEGWSGDSQQSKTWTGYASSVSFSGDIMGNGQGVTLKFTIEESGSSTPAWVKPGDSWDEDTKTLTVNSNPGHYAYGEAEDIEHLIISSTVTEIGEQAFAVCINLETIDFSEGLQNINGEAFTSCEKLESVILPATLKSVGTLVFSYDEKLKSVTINAPSLDYYGSLAFEYTHEDLKIYVPAESVATYKSNWSGYADRIEAIGGDEPAGDEITVTWNSYDLPSSGSGKSFTKDGVTITCGGIEWEDLDFYNGGTFTTDLGNFTKIEVYAGWVTTPFGEGWSGSNERQTWTGNASSVSFSGEFMSAGEEVNLTFTIEPKGSATAVENVQTNQVRATKFFRDGMLLIEKNGKTYTVQGVEVR